MNGNSFIFVFLVICLLNSSTESLFSDDDLAAIASPSTNAPGIRSYGVSRRSWRRSSRVLPATDVPDSPGLPTRKRYSFAPVVSYDTKPSTDPVQPSSGSSAPSPSITNWHNSYGGSGPSYGPQTSNPLYPASNPRPNTPSSDPIRDFMGQQIAPETSNNKMFTIGQVSQCALLKRELHTHIFVRSSLNSGPAKVTGVTVEMPPDMAPGVTIYLFPLQNGTSLVNILTSHDQLGFMVVKWYSCMGIPTSLNG
ncbi:uncharacterized protein LOC129746275 [Uranotaenia lowii]|uniref:uncharacterized protein LOC129746275 n=1 Tax=Uranotaenia lowii TaxID=190385 RepID=UPI0024783815|nr:uncharacterized protein LOC129746275 [Uranotaenia lowii]